MAECCIEFADPVSKGTISQLVIEYLKYILYYRGQFPLPLDQLKQSIDAHDKSIDVEIHKHTIYRDNSEEKICNQGYMHRPSVLSDRTKQKFVDAVNKFDEFFKQLLGILDNKEVLEVVLNLGPNMMSPKELHRITLPYVHCSNLHCVKNSAPFHKCRLNFFRSIMHSSVLENLSNDCLAPISVLLLLRSGVQLTAEMEQKRFYALPKKAKRVTVHFNNNCQHVSDMALVNFQEDTHHEGLWVKLKAELKGFKSYIEAEKSMSSGALL